MRDNAHTLSDFRVPTLSIECEPCGRRGRYNAARLIEKYGDMKLPELWHVLANCPKAKSFSVHDRCKVRYDAATIESREPDEPDIRCVHDTDGPIAFELVQLTSPEIAKNVGDQIKRGAKSETNWTVDPTGDAIRGKIAKKYETDCPIELLCYAALTVSTDDQILDTIERITSDQGLGPFRRIWLLGEERHFVRT